MSTEMNDDQESFADAMHDVQPLSKGKNVVRNTVREDSSIAQENRRLSAEGKLKPAKDENYLTLGEVHLSSLGVFGMEKNRYSKCRFRTFKKRSLRY